MTNVTLPSPTEIPHLIATHISRTSTRGKKIASVDLAGQINEITLQTQLAGASVLTITVDDPELAFWTSGMLDVDDEGLLDIIEVNFPDGSDSWWRLCAANLTWGTDLVSSNVVITFEDRIVAYLRDKWGPKTVAHGTTTRAQFIHQLVQEVGRGDGLTPIKFVCPSINIVQPLASSTTSGITVPSSSRAAAATATAAATTGGTSAVGGASTTWYNAVCSQESNDLGLNSGGGCGAHQTSASLDGYSELMNNTGLGGLPCDTELFIKANGRTIRARKVDSGAGSSFNPQMGLYPRVSQYLFGTSNGGEFHVQIQRVDGKPINIVGGGTTTAPQGSASPAGTPATPAKPISDISQLTRGTADNPDESSWDCIQRLAQEVDWYAFSDANTLYYMDGPDLRNRKPSLYLELDTTHGPRWLKKDSAQGTVTADIVSSLDGTYDNSAFIYRSTKKVRGKVQRRSRIAKPQTPAEIQVSVICDIDEFASGQVAVFQSAGPLNDRWIMSDVTRNILGDTFSQLTLIPPTAPLPEPQGIQPSSTAVGGMTVASSASVQAALDAAKLLSSMNIPYPSPDQHFPGSNDQAHPPPLDCSSSTSWILHRAGMFPSADPIVSGDFAVSWGQPGQGNEMTVWANNGHVFIEFKVGGQHLQANTSPAGGRTPPIISGSDAGTGCRLFGWGGPGASDAASGSFTPRHWPNT